MPEEQPTSTLRQEFEETYSDTLEVFTVNDRKQFVDWLEQGPGGFNFETDALMKGLDNNRYDFTKPIHKHLALIAAKFFSMGLGLGTPADRKLIAEKLEIAVGGKANLKAIVSEGFEESGGKIQFQPNLFNNDEVTTDLAGKVEDAVDEWFTDSPQQQLEKIQTMYQARENAIITANQRAENAERQQHSDGEEIALLHRKLEEKKAFEGEVWGDKERQAATAVYEALPEKVRRKIEVVMKKVDLEKPDEELLTSFKEFGGFEIADLAKWGNNWGEILAVLPAIMHLKLEEKRKIIAEKEAVREYFETHELVLQLNQDGADFTISGSVGDDLYKQLTAARTLGVDIFEAEKEISVATKNEEITGLVFGFDGQGNIIKTVITSKTLSEEALANSQVLEEEMITVFGSQRQQENQPYRFVRDEEGKFVVKFNDDIVGRVEFNQQQGEMIISWEVDKEGHYYSSSAGMFVSNKLAEKWGEGKKLGGLELKAVKKAEAVK